MTAWGCLKYFQKGKEWGRGRCSADLHSHSGQYSTLCTNGRAYATDFCQKEVVVAMQELQHMTALDQLSLQGWLTRGMKLFYANDALRLVQGS